MFNLSAAMGPKFAEIAREMTEKIKKLGPSPIRVKGAETELEKEAENLTTEVTESKGKSKKTL